MSARAATRNHFVPALVAAAFALSALLAAPALADVTVTQKTTGKGPIGTAASGESVQYLKGSKMRVDQTRGEDETSMIIDADAQRMVSLNHKKKEAEIYDMARITADMQKIQASDIKASVTPTSQTRQIAGQTCTVHNIEIEIPMTMGNNAMSMLMSGPACLVKDAPGAKDYEAFYKTAVEKGLFFSDPRQAKAQPGQAKGMARLYQEMASRGMPVRPGVHDEVPGQRDDGRHDEQDGRRHDDDRSDVGHGRPGRGYVVRDSSRIQTEAAEVKRQC